ncbi:MAG: ABC transporter permease [Spirochaetales bacterium]|nr:ABC transporter permease [Spirochaetales bacterium]MCF7937682.1 ABC transporter permease [Spirochaetales bacterium]
MSPLLDSIFSSDFGFAVLRVMTPLIFPALGFAITDLAGVVNISLEGMMLMSAFFGVIVGAFTGSLLLALLAGILIGIAMGAALGYFHLKLKTDIILGAIAMNMFASGFTIFLLYVLTGDKGSTSSLKSLVFPEVHIPLLRSIPVLGDILSGHNVLTYAALLSAIVFFFLIFKTPLGLRIRAVGQNPDAARSVGINVDRVQLYALMLSGLFGALGGLYLSMGYVSWFARDMTAGRGWIAIAAATLGGNMPLGTFLAALLFGSVNALAIYIASVNIPSELIQMIPYVATVLALALYAIRVQKRRQKIKEEALEEEYDSGPPDNPPPAAAKQRGGSS